MRILLANHVPLDDADAGLSTSRLAARLQAAGHDVRAIVVDRDQKRDEETIVTQRIVCGSSASRADLAFQPPRFGSHAGDQPRFAALTDEQLVVYRDALRTAVDAEVADFDPQVIHCAQIWLFGHLALESGVPYVLEGNNAELDEYDADPRYRRLADEAAENAGRIIVANAAVYARVHQMFGDLDGRVVIVPTAANDVSRIDDSNVPLEWLTDIYAHVLADRHGAQDG